VRGDSGFPTRIAFTKHGKVRFISHRDVARAFERAFRIEALPLAFTQGFSPRPKVSFGLALSVGHESDAEYLDVELAEPVPLGPLGPALTAALPEGIAVSGVVPLVDRAPALQEAVGAVEWEIEVRGATPDVDVAPASVTARVDAVLAATTVPVERVRKGRISTDDIRPAIRRLAVHGPSEAGTRLAATLATRPASLRPAELLRALGPEYVEGRVRRTRQWIERDGEWHDPRVVDTRIAVEARAS
jgi:radical SAM-linked protein